MKITHVAEIMNITNVAGILEAEICVAKNMRAVLMYNRENVIRKKKEKGRRYPIKARLFNYYIGVGVVIHTINKTR